MATAKQIAARKRFLAMIKAKQGKKMAPAAMKASKSVRAGVAKAPQATKVVKAVRAPKRSAPNSVKAPKATKNKSAKKR